jgi:hypothetical protein
MRALWVAAVLICLGTSATVAAERRSLPCSADPKCRGYNPPGGVDMRAGTETRITGTQPFRNGSRGSGTQPANRIQQQGIPQRR